MWWLLRIREQANCSEKVRKEHVVWPFKPVQVQDAHHAAWRRGVYRHRENNSQVWGWVKVGDQKKAWMFWIFYCLCFKKCRISGMLWLKQFTHTQNKCQIMSVKTLCCSHDTSFYWVRKYLSLIPFPLKIVVSIKWEKKREELKLQEIEIFFRRQEYTK